MLSEMHEHIATAHLRVLFHSGDKCPVGFPNIFRAAPHAYDQVDHVFPHALATIAANAI